MEVVQTHPAMAVPGPESLVDLQKVSDDQDLSNAQGLIPVPGPEPAKVPESRPEPTPEPKPEATPVTPIVEETPPEPVPAPAEAKVTEWEAILDKGDQETSLGVDIRIAKTHLVVQKVNEGLVKNYNDANPNKAIKPGAVILEVNGASSDAQKIYDAVRAAKVLQVKLRYVSEFSLTVPKDGALGMDCKRSVMEVKLLKKDGIIPVYNKSCTSGYEVNVGDRIVAVNGQFLDPEKLLNAITQVKGNLTLTIRRNL